MPSRAIPAKWRWHHRVLLSLYSRLLGDCRDLRRAGAEPLEAFSLDPADSATDEFDHDLALSRLSGEQEALYEVNQALKRLMDGSYGTCEETGRAIPAARLRAIPWARFTREVEDRLEKKGLLPPAHLNRPATVRSSGRIWLAPEEEAEEVAEQPPPPPKDEVLSQVFSPPGKHARRPRSSNRSPSATRKGQRK